MEQEQLLQLIQLHELKEKSSHSNYESLLGQVCRLLNRQWPISDRMRMDMLRESSNDFPMHFVLLLETTLLSVSSSEKELIQLDNQSFELIGYCKLNTPNRQDFKLIVESVIIDPGKRGGGHGKRLMNLLMHFLSSQDSIVSQCPPDDCHLYLSTHDQVPFYESCGFAVCSEDQVPKSTKAVASKFSQAGLNNLLSVLGNKQQQASGPALNSTSPVSSSGRHVQTWMRKSLASEPNSGQA